MFSAQLGLVDIDIAYYRPPNTTDVSRAELQCTEHYNSTHYCAFVNATMVDIEETRFAPAVWKFHADLELTFAPSVVETDYYTWNSVELLTTCDGEPSLDAGVSRQRSSHESPGGH